MFSGAGTGEGIGQPVVLSTEPDWLCPVIMLDLIVRINAGHPEAIVVSRPAVFNEIKTRL